MKKHLLKSLYIKERGLGRGFYWRPKKLKSFSTESVAFNKSFYMRTENAEEALYFLTPNIIEKIEKLNKDLEGLFTFLIIGNEIYITLDSKKFSDDFKVFKSIYKQKIKITEIIETIFQFVSYVSK